jgi:hypothetical protein
MLISEYLPAVPSFFFLETIILEHCLKGSIKRLDNRIFDEY